MDKEDVVEAEIFDIDGGANDLNQIMRRKGAECQ